MVLGIKKKEKVIYPEFTPEIYSQIDKTYLLIIWLSFTFEECVFSVVLCKRKGQSTCSTYFIEYCYLHQICVLKNKTHRLVFPLYKCCFIYFPVSFHFCFHFCFHFRFHFPLPSFAFTFHFPLSPEKQGEHEQDHGSDFLQTFPCPLSPEKVNTNGTTTSIFFRPRLWFSSDHDSDFHLAPKR